jgi:F420H(2)-dependent quinone reductase
MADEAMTSERELNERNIEEFRRNGGKVGGPFESFPLLLLTSTGAKSGAQRVNPVGYFDIVAHELPRDERDRIYAVIVQRAPGFGEYEERTDRVIPVFELTPDG